MSTDPEMRPPANIPKLFLKPNVDRFRHLANIFVQALEQGEYKVSGSDSLESFSDEERVQVRRLFVDEIGNPKSFTVDQFPSLNWLDIGPSFQGQLIVDAPQLSFLSCSTDQIDSRHPLFLDKLRILFAKHAQLALPTAVERVHDLVVQKCDAQSLQLGAKRLGLESLTVMQCGRLESVSGPTALEGVKRIYASGCKRLDLGEFPIHLESLDLHDCAPLGSLRDILSLQKLRRLSFSGSTKILDGDTQSLQNQLDRFEYVFIKNSPSYNCRVEGKGVPARADVKPSFHRTVYSSDDLRKRAAAIPRVEYRLLRTFGDELGGILLKHIETADFEETVLGQSEDRPAIGI